tara:strand:- start:215 stop:472 length:258 start_codon:yes stop_codon:yes gene_type:complete
MLIKFEADPALVDRIKAYSCERTGSKAFLVAASDAPDLVLELRRLRSELSQANETILVQRQTLEQARSAALALVERCGQGDLING